MSTFERYLTVWVALCIVAGIALGHELRGFADVPRKTGMPVIGALEPI